MAVVGTSIDQCYPAQSAGLLRSILYSGAAISEYPPGKRAYAAAVPRRNRIISGLCLGVVVAEAPAKSGSLITAGLALDQGRDVFAVPGSVDSPASEGCNELIARGAKLVRSARDVLEEYVGLYPIRTGEEEQPRETSRPAVPEKTPAERPKSRPEPAPPTLEAVFSRPEGEPGDPVLEAVSGIVHLDDLRQRTGLETPALLARLTLLELQGRVRQLPGQYYEKL